MKKQKKTSSKPVASAVKQVSPSRLQAERLNRVSRWATIIGVLLMLFLFGTILLVSQRAIREPQDVRRDAMVADGAVKLTTTLSPAEARVGQLTRLQYDINTGNTRVNGVELLFDIVTETLDSSEIQVIGLHPDLVFAYQELDAVDHGFKVRIIALTRNPQQGFAAPAAAPLFALDFTPQRTGSIEVNFDVERSIAPEYRSNPIIDHLQSITTFTVPVLAATATTPPETGGPEQTDDLYFSETRLERDLRFFTDDDRRSPLNQAQLESGKSYRFTAVARIANRVLQPEATNAQDLLIRLRAVNHTQTQTLPYQSLLRSGEPLAVAFEGTFTAAASNTFTITLDPDNRITETLTNNNDLTYSFSIGQTQTTTDEPTPAACNERCTSNANCPVNFRCYDTGADGKRCRLATNVNATSCTASSTQAAAQTTTTATTTAAAAARTIQSCNQACSSNRDCAVNFRCYQGACRLATNPSSLTCTSADAGVVSEQYKKGDPGASLPPTTSPIPSPTPTPLVIEPEPEYPPEQTAWDTFWVSLMKQWDKWLGSSNLILPIAIVLLGVILLLTVLVLALNPNKGTVKRSKESTSTLPPAPPLSSKPNPAPPPLPGHGVTPPNRGTQAAPSSSMLERLQSKGIKQPGDTRS